VVPSQCLAELSRVKVRRCLRSSLAIELQMTDTSPLSFSGALGTTLENSAEVASFWLACRTL
jgi:hypothetical protein